MNLKVRLKNPIFWISMVAQIIALMLILGVDVVDKVPILEEYETIITMIFALLGTLGIAIDPTTEGLKDSQTVMDRK